MVTKSITDVTASVFSLLEPLAPEDRKRVVNAVFTLLGEPAPGNELSASGGKPGTLGGDLGAFGPKARQWLSNHRLTRDKLDRVFYFQDGKVDIHLTTVVGEGKKEQTINCYLLVGAKSYLETDNPTIADGEAIALCKHTQAYDKNNHTTNRKALGIYVTGSRGDGFTLIGSGLKKAAELLLRTSDSKAP
jgi:hypothetical protein